MISQFKRITGSRRNGSQNRIKLKIKTRRRDARMTRLRNALEALQLLYPNPSNSADLSKKNKHSPLKPPVAHSSLGQKTCLSERIPITALAITSVQKVYNKKKSPHSSCQCERGRTEAKFRIQRYFVPKLPFRDTTQPTFFFFLICQLTFLPCQGDFLDNDK